MLKQKKRIELAEDVSSWRNQLVQWGITEYPVSGDIGIQSTELLGFHADPADRFIVSTAIKHKAKLITADGKILAWEGSLTCEDASL